jgi:hypothetical protein
LNGMITFLAIGYSRHEEYIAFPLVVAPWKRHQSLR